MNRRIPPVEAYGQLDPAEQELLQEWIALAVRPAYRPNRRRSTEIRAAFEEEGFPISEEAFAGAMLAAGYRGWDERRRAAEWIYFVRPWPGPAWRPITIARHWNWFSLVCVDETRYAVYSEKRLALLRQRGIDPEMRPEEDPLQRTYRNWPIALHCVEAFKRLPAEEQEVIIHWIATCLRPATSVNVRHSEDLQESFALDAFPISHEALKGAMIVAGYKPARSSLQYAEWRFRIKSVFYRRMRPKSLPRHIHYGIWNLGPEAEVAFAAYQIERRGEPRHATAHRSPHATSAPLGG